MFWFCQWFIHILKTVHLQQLTELKGKQSSKLGMWEGYGICQKKIYWRGTFSAKVVYKRVGDWTYRPRVVLNFPKRLFEMASFLIKYILTRVFQLNFWRSRPVSEKPS